MQHRPTFRISGFDETLLSLLQRERGAVAEVRVESSSSITSGQWPTLQAHLENETANSSAGPQDNQPRLEDCG
jgi:hypothetical protein